MCFLPSKTIKDTYLSQEKTSSIKVNGASHKGNTPFLGEAIKIKIVLFYALTIKPDC